MELYSLKFKHNNKAIKIITEETLCESYNGTPYSSVERRFEFCEQNEPPFLTSYKEIINMLAILNKNQQYNDIDTAYISYEKEYYEGTLIYKEEQFELVKYDLKII